MRHNLEKRPLLIILLAIIPIVLLFTIGFAYLGTLFSELIYGVAIGPSIVLETKKQIQAFRFVQIFSVLGTFLLPALCLNYIVLKPVNRLWHINMPKDFKMWGITALSLLCLLPLMYILYALNKAIELPSFFSVLEGFMQEQELLRERVLFQFLSLKSPLDFIVNIFLLCGLAAVGEELFFRGCIQAVLERLIERKWLAVFIAAFIFSFVHFQFYGFFPRLAMGLVLGFVFLWTGNILLSIELHFLFNFIQIFSHYLWDDFISEQFMDLSLIAMLAVTFVSGTLLLVLLRLLYRYAQEKKSVSK